MTHTKPIPGPLSAALSLSLVLFAYSSAAVAQEQEKDQLYVKDFAWTNQVTADRTVDQKFTDVAPISPITLWTRVVGSQKALDILRAQNRLPIWHQWYISCGAEVDFLSAARPIAEIDLKIDGDDVLDALETEVQSRNFFDWRTWSMKENVNGCRYTVRIVDNQSDPIYCEELHGDCVLTIKLSN